MDRTENAFWTEERSKQLKIISQIVLVVIFVVVVFIFARDVFFKNKGSL
jgi:preprotein translocase subunit SecE